MLGWEMRSHYMAQDQQGPVFFDRGVPDVIAYLRLMEWRVPAHVMKAASVFRYNPLVFIAPHWPRIFTTDSERK